MSKTVPMRPTGSPRQHGPDKIVTMDVTIRIPSDWLACVDRQRGQRSRGDFILDVLQVRLLENGATLSTRRPRGRPKLVKP